jgi:hypothetical protein
MKVRNIFLHIFVILILFTSLRRLTVFYYAPIVLYLSFIFITHKYTYLKIDKSFKYFYLYFAYTIFVIIWSFIYMNSFTAPLIGVPRILLMLILCQIMYWQISSDYDVIQILKIILLCYCIGGLSLWFQAYYGNIPWFAGMAGRGGVIRYSSILGSLTIFGSICGYAYILLFSKIININKIIKLIMFLIIVSSTFVSMQKTGLIMLAISVLILFIFNRVFTKNKISMKKLILVILCILCLVALVKTIPTLERYYNANFTITFGQDIPFVDSSKVTKDSALTSKSITDRLYGRTFEAMQTYGYLFMIIGIGMMGGGGAMGIDFGMVHSTIGDILMMGGVLYLIIFFVLYVNVQLFLYRNRMNSVSSTLFLCNLLLLVNMLFTSGAIIQPSISIVFWLSVAYVARKSTFQKKLRIV